MVEARSCIYSSISLWSLSQQLVEVPMTCPVPVFSQLLYYGSHKHQKASCQNATKTSSCLSWSCKTCFIYHIMWHLTLMTRVALWKCLSQKKGLFNTPKCATSGEYAIFYVLEKCYSCSFWEIHIVDVQLKDPQ